MLYFYSVCFLCIFLLVIYLYRLSFCSENTNNVEDWYKIKFRVIDVKLLLDVYSKTVTLDMIDGTSLSFENKGGVCFGSSALYDLRSGHMVYFQSNDSAYYRRINTTLPKPYEPSNYVINANKELTFTDSDNNVISVNTDQIKIITNSLPRISGTEEVIYNKLEKIL